jgi:hypothetical protein
MDANAARRPSDVAAGAIVRSVSSSVELRAGDNLTLENGSTVAAPRHDHFARRFR